MVDVVLSSDNVTVLGGPDQINVDLNIGASGSRGSFFFTGFENPGSLTTQDFSQAPQIFDIYIVVDPTSDNYLQAYQYLNEDGVLSWVESFKISESITAFNKVVTFNSGAATLQIDIADIGLENVTFESFVNSFAHFNVQASISNIDVAEAPSGTINNNPVAFSFNVNDAFFDSSGGGVPSEYPMKVNIDFTAVEYADGSWTALDGKDVVVHLRIEFVNPDEVLANLGGES
jgi:hypothetical protein